MTALSPTANRTCSRHAVSRSVILALFALEGACTLILLALYKKGTQTFSQFLSTRSGVIFLVGVGVLFASAGWIIHTYANTTKSGSKDVQLAVAMNLATIIGIVLCAEATLRILAKQTPQGESINGMLLLPKNWDTARRHFFAVWEKASGTREEQSNVVLSSYVVYDPDLGWAIGANRKSENGLYFSDAQGLRTPNSGKDMTLPSTPLIAALGDSFTFGEEVAYTDTWPAQLEKFLEGQFVVANFGVPGYGVDQAYLRYTRDVRHRRPSIALLAFISHDLFRSMAVYSFLNFPEWDNPFSKPRFLTTEAGLRLVNVPAIPPETIFAKSVIADLPYLEYDMGYYPLEWQQNWYHVSYIARFLFSRFPRWMPSNPNAELETVFSLNGRIMRSFIKQANDSGTLPVIIYLPTSGDFRPESPNMTGRTFLRRAGIPHLDPTPCLAQMPEAERFQPGGHYSPRGNAAVARCIAQGLRDILLSSTVQTSRNGS